MNIEHSFPKSWWGGTQNDAYKDIHHLYPSSSKDNSQKGNFPMATVTNMKHDSGAGYDKVGSTLLRDEHKTAGNQEIHGRAIFHVLICTWQPPIRT